MPQLTIHLDKKAADFVKKAAKAAGVSKSRWVADVIQSRARAEWPAIIREAAGSWDDFPSLEEIRKGYGKDAPRERL